MEELYSYDKYRGHHIYITDDTSGFFGDIYQNGTCIESGIRGISGDSCLSKCKDKIDCIIDYEVEE